MKQLILLLSSFFYLIAKPIILLLIVHLIYCVVLWCYNYSHYIPIQSKTLLCILPYYPANARTPPPILNFSLDKNSRGVHRWDVSPFLARIIGKNLLIFRSETTQHHVVDIRLYIDIIDYVTGIVNSSREQYIRAARGTIRVALICPKKQKFNKKWPKIGHFSNAFDNIYLTKTFRSLKIGYPSGPAFLLTVDSDNKLLPSVFEAF